jgi:hypothetical protein
MKEQHVQSYKYQLENNKRDRELWEKIKNLQQKELIFLRQLLLEKDAKIKEN